MPLFIEPNAGVSPVLQVIQSAHRELDMGVYYLDDRKILSAVREAVRRGVDVRIMVEPKPYGMKPWQVRKEVRDIEATGAHFRYVPSRFVSHGDHYAFYHAKYCANGHEAEIGTANFDWSGLGGRNREYLYDTKNPQVVRAVQAVFDADWDRQRAPSWAHRVLVLSPGTSAAQLLEVINQPGPIDVESEELGPYRPVLDALAAKGKDLRLILPASINSEDQRDVAYLRSHGCQVRLMPVKPIYLHAKMIAGDHLAFIGSENFTQTSLQDNREMGLVLNGNDITKLQAQFNRDWALSGGKTMAGGGAGGLMAKAKGWLSRF
ncbi:MULTISPECIES: phospholipase D-like domain-containing protein [Acidithiobacillaceae]|uniref:phospholipase D n=1 Tax=Igneacidithiobacillus copahuensis TaxID=2724909 RepID=A0AAE2YR93_9PROT|nr:phospholipase D-like domain-containing protein [Acidithiobacillus caldus]MBU2763329.1 GTP-binding protein [Acidithiobacillus caldus]MBU2771173.1 GTP-binding protein [Acidithiobacillus caldus]MBU2788400.1 GTP-binding protein [Igneacidithiobacillus copahuensis]MBU2796363.1 GTP-binding protein [Acidithiobacillus sp. VAN18-2]